MRFLVQTPSVTLCVPPPPNSGEDKATYYSAQTSPPRSRGGLGWGLNVIPSKVSVTTQNTNINPVDVTELQIG